ncbi:MAG: DUF1465 domain-containing protein [Citromicrobium sp.]|nr:MAG: DUF1465 domain-containing protein [Citromicrobium sp.]
MSRLALVATHVPTYEDCVSESESTLTRQVVETLYADALMLSDEARAIFDLRRRDARPGEYADAELLALSVEGLRTTTRIMHVLAWLLNRRAWFSGELTQAQLDKVGKLEQDRPSDPVNLAQLDPATRALIAESERLHARVARLDTAGPARREMPVQAMHSRIVRAFDGD